MNSQAGASSTVVVPPAPVAPPTGPRERRMRFGHLALAVALIVVGALGTVALVTTVSATGEYLALRRDVEANARLTVDDLTVVRINAAPGLKPVAGQDLDRVVGLYAAVPLSEGTLLTAAQLTAQPLPGPGQQVLGITLGADRLPATRPSSGDRVLLVATPARGAAAGDASQEPPRTWPATVVQVVGSGSGSFLGRGGADTVTLDVAVAAADGPTVATLAATDRLVVVLTGD